MHENYFSFKDKYSLLYTVIIGYDPVMSLPVRDGVFPLKIQSILVISKSKGPSEILRDIRTSTYQMCTTEENINRTTKFHK